MFHHENQSKVMDNILGFARDVVSTSLSITKDVADKMVDYANDLTGTRPHNIIHCGSRDSVIRCPVSYSNHIFYILELFGYFQDFFLLNHKSNHKCFSI